MDALIYPAILFVLSLLGMLVGVKYKVFEPREASVPEPLPPIEPEPVVAPVVVPTPAPKPVKTMREHLYDVSYGCLGIDMAPTQDYVGCAEALSFVLMKAGVKGLPKGGILSTAELDKWLARNLTAVSSPLPGDIIMSPTGAGNGSVRGHTGVVGKAHIMSNNSQTTLWDDHWTLEDWRAYYGKRGGLPVKFYRP